MKIALLLIIYTKDNKKNLYDHYKDFNHLEYRWRKEEDEINDTKLFFSQINNFYRFFIRLKKHFIADYY